MPRFFVSETAFYDGKVKIKGDDAYHIARSLRMREGEHITVCDEKMHEHLCRLLKIRDEFAECEILETKDGKNESPVDITLFMAYPKADKLEFVIQKAVELGAGKIIPFESSRCIKRPGSDKAEKQNARFSRIAEEAAKQCGRSRLPTIDLPISFDEALTRAKESELPLFCYEGSETLSLKSVLESHRHVKSISVIVGSEGGFSEKESEKAVKIGLIPVNLGPRILRCETAPTYVLSAISYYFEL